MSAILDRAKAHHAALPRREIDIPEWGPEGQPLRVTWSALTLRDRERIHEDEADGRTASGATLMIRAVIIKACDADGKPLFDAMAEHDLRYNVSSEVVTRISNAILYSAGIKKADGAAVSTEDQVDAAKNA